MEPLQFYPNQVFDQRKHIVDVAAKEYVKKATANVHHLVPAEVTPDGNCLYHSILLVMNNSTLTTSELRGLYIYFSSMLLHKLLCNNF